MSSLPEMRKAIQLRRDSLNKKLGIKEQAESNLKSEQDLLEQTKINQSITNQGYLFLLSEIQDRRKKTIEIVEETGNYALQKVFGPGHFLKFETFDEQNKGDGASTFKMELLFGTPYKNDITIWNELKDSSGGSVSQIASLALRDSTMRLLNYQGTLLLDEICSNVSMDSKIEEVIELLLSIAKDNERQIIFVTHNMASFEKIADKIIYIDKDLKDGKANVKYI